MGDFLFYERQVQKVKVSYNDIVEAVAILLGDYSIIRKQAAILILKIALPSDFFKFLFEDKSLHPFDRNDPRVRIWKNKIISKGKCELCGSKENLDAHHIIKWADYPIGRIDVQNGMCLCHKCHTEEHKGEVVYSMMKATI
jgi:hypothetical protein